MGGVYLSPAPALSLTWILSIASFHRLRAIKVQYFLFVSGFPSTAHQCCYICYRHSCIYRNEGGRRKEKKHAVAPRCVSNQAAECAAMSVCESTQMVTCVLGTAALVR